MPRGGREHAQIESSPTTKGPVYEEEQEDQPSPPVGRCPNSALEPEAYLRFHGWKSDDEGNWPDPLAVGVDRQVPIGERKNDRGEREIVYQTVCAPLPWTYRLADAVDLQQQREGAAKR